MHLRSSAEEREGRAASSESKRPPEVDGASRSLGLKRAAELPHPALDHPKIDVEELVEKAEPPAFGWRTSCRCR